MHITDVYMSVYIYTYTYININVYIALLQVAGVCYSPFHHGFIGGSLLASLTDIHGDPATSS